MTHIPPPIRRLRRQRAIETAVQVVAVIGFVVFLIVRGGKYLP